MPLPTPVGDQVRLTVGSEEMTILLSGERRQPDGYGVLELTRIGERLRDELAQYLPEEARNLIKSLKDEAEWYLDDPVDDNLFFPLVGRLLLEPKVHAIASELLISDFVAPRLRATVTAGSYPPPLHARVMLYLDGNREPLNPHPFPVNKVEVPG